MHLKQFLHPGRRKYAVALILVSLLAVICLAFSMGDHNVYDSSRREILLRRIGHEILVQSGDSVSRVLPVKKIAENEYRISFENAFTFSPDSLVHTTKHLLANDPMGSDYVVNVLNCADSSVAYGYAISENGKNDIIACLGRTQPKGCYSISIKFQSAGENTAKNRYLLGSLALLTVAGAIFLRRSKPRSGPPENGSAIPEDHPTRFQHPPAAMFTLGSMLFDAETRKLMINGQTIDLTKTETRVLRIFAVAPNEAIERSRLQKEIWEDEGVIVGRSLDMFISKLRKKLELDPTIRIVVIRGKGYKLQISS